MVQFHYHMGKKADPCILKSERWHVIFNRQNNQIRSFLLWFDFIPFYGARYHSGL